MLNFSKGLILFKTAISKGNSSKGFSTISSLKRLRDETGSPIINVKKALEDFKGDYE